MPSWEWTSGWIYYLLSTYGSYKPSTQSSPCLVLMTRITAGNRHLESFPLGGMCGRGILGTTISNITFFFVLDILGFALFWFWVPVIVWEDMFWSCLYIVFFCWQKSLKEGCEDSVYVKQPCSNLHQVWKKAKLGFSRNETSWQQL